jgi:hypothetical protein
MGLYDVMLSHPYVRTEAEARSRLDDLGIDPDEISLLELEEEEDFDEEEGYEEDEFEDEEPPEAEGEPGRFNEPEDEQPA